MAGPVFNSVGTRAQSAGATTLSPTKPSAASTNGFMLAVVTSKNNATHSTATSGWSLIAQVNSGASFTASLWQAKGNAGAPTFTWSGSVACSAQIACYDDAANVVDTAIGASGSNSGATSTHSTSAITTTRANSLAVYVDVSAANTAMAAPSGWTEQNDAGSATDAGRTVWGDKAVASLGGSSGAISVTGANAAWVQFQVEIMGEAPAANALQVSKAGGGAWVEPRTDAASFATVSMGAWLDAPNQVDFSKVEMGAWAEPPEGFALATVEVGVWLDVGAASLPVRRRQVMVN
ncbi:hypothetical protein [Tsuneonella sp. HG222]